MTTGEGLLVDTEGLYQEKKKRKDNIERQDLYIWEILRRCIGQVLANQQIFIELLKLKQ